jgi:hypothetical protein
MKQSRSALVLLNARGSGALVLSMLAEITKGEMSVERLVVRCLWAVLILTPLLHAQQSQWQDLNLIRPGTKIQVVENSLKSTSGKFVGFSETDITLKVENKDVVIPRDQVHRVSISGKNRKRNTLIGLGAGAAAGLALGVALMERESGYGGAVAGSTVGFAGVGAGIGALLPAGKTVYRAENPKQGVPKAQLTKE